MFLCVAMLFARAHAVAQSTGTATVNYSYSGNGQTFTVPVGVTSITLKVWGGGGGNGEKRAGQCCDAEGDRQPAEAGGWADADRLDDAEVTASFTTLYR